MPGMQFPYPRKSSGPSTYTTSRASTFQRRRLLQRYGPPFVGLALLACFLLWLFSGPTSSIPYTPPGTPEVVIVTTLDPNLPEEFQESIKENRQHYAKRHGYATFFPNVTDYDLMDKVPSSWSTIPALRHAMTVYPHSQWLWYLSSTALIMNPKESLEAKLLQPRKLESVMITDKPVVPPDSVIKTFSHLRGERVDFILTQDTEGLAGDSMFIRIGEWAKFFLDAWYDPLYRSYNFQKAEGHALEHIVQWHGTILAKLALVPQKLLNCYTKEAGAAAADGVYEEGDFIANFRGCQVDKTRHCEQEMAPFLSRWRELGARE